MRLVIGLLFITGLLRASEGPLERAQERYNRTDYTGAMALLGSPESAHSLELLGQCYFMQGEFKKATEYIQKATTLAPANSEYMDWLGRTWGKRAETSNILAAPGYASKARQAFEKSVELNPKNNDALSDLFDYYLEAPGFLGGGYDKAVAVANKLAVIDPAEAYFQRAKLAYKKKEYQSAEAHMRQAIAVAPHEVGHLIALARLLANQGKERESDAVFLEAQKANPNAPQVWFAHADVLIKQKRDLHQAKLLLEKYMSASITVDDPPKGEARRLLKQVGGV